MESILFDLAQSGFWDYRETVLPVVAAAPLVLEIGIIVKKIFQNPKEVQDKLIVIKNFTKQSFSRSLNENNCDFSKRLIKNILISLGGSLFIIGTAAYILTILPSSLSIPTAILTIYSSMKFLVNATKYKNRLVQAFTPQEEEAPSEARLRIIKNGLKVLGFAAVLGTAAAIAIHIIGPMLSNGFSWSVDLPFQTKEVVFGEYAAVGVVHAYLAYKSAQKKDKQQALYHVIGLILSLAFPLSYWGEGMRLHHSFYGLLLMAAPFRALRIFGSIVTFDSFLYKIVPFRGYIGADGQEHWYDFINIVADNFPYFTIPYAGAIVVEDAASFQKE